MLEKPKWDRLERDDVKLQVFFTPTVMTRHSHLLAMKITFLDGRILWFNESELHMIAELITSPPTPMPILSEEENESNSI